MRARRAAEDGAWGAWVRDEGWVVTGEEAGVRGEEPEPEESAGREASEGGGTLQTG